jgi:hypothetical protein
MAEADEQLSTVSSFGRPRMPQKLPLGYNLSTASGHLPTLNRPTHFAKRDVELLGRRQTKTAPRPPSKSQQP